MQVPGRLAEKHGHALPPPNVAADEGHLPSSGDEISIAFGEGREGDDRHDPERGEARLLRLMSKGVRL